MKMKNINRYSPLAAGLKLLALPGEARLRGLYRIISSKSIISVYTPHRAPQAATEMNFGRNYSGCLAFSD
jgi:hypothetical protein